MTIMIGAGSLAEANPGGHLDKTEKKKSWIPKPAA
jgi:hypothetical protein